MHEIPLFMINDNTISENRRKFTLVPKYMHFENVEMKKILLVLLVIFWFKGAENMYVSFFKVQSCKFLRL